MVVDVIQTAWRAGVQCVPAILLKGIGPEAVSMLRSVTLGW